MDGYSPSTDPRLLPPVDSPGRSTVHETGAGPSPATDEAKSIIGGANAPPVAPNSSPTIPAMSYNSKERNPFSFENTGYMPPTYPYAAVPYFGLYPRRERDRSFNAYQFGHCLPMPTRPPPSTPSDSNRDLPTVLPIRDSPNRWRIDAQPPVRHPFMNKLCKYPVKLLRILMSTMIVKLLVWVLLSIMKLLVILLCTITSFAWAAPWVILSVVWAAFFPIFFVCDLCICGTSCPYYDPNDWPDWDDWPLRLVCFGIGTFKDSATPGCIIIWLCGCALVNTDGNKSGFYSWVGTSILDQLWALDRMKVGTRRGRTF